jgi:hypothetical protein
MAIVIIIMAAIMIMVMMFIIIISDISNKVESTVRSESSCALRLL